jgi:hypothetical protein
MLPNMGTRCEGMVQEDASCSDRGEHALWPPHSKPAACTVSASCTRRWLALNALLKLPLLPILALLCGLVGFWGCRPAWFAQPLLMLPVALVRRVVAAAVEALLPAMKPASMRAKCCSASTGYLHVVAAICSHST